MNEFKIGMEFAKDFASIIEVIGTLVSRANFSLKTKGFLFRAMDDAHVAMVTLKLPVEWFEMYSTATPQDIQLNLIDLGRILKRAGAKDSLTLTGDAQNNKLRVQFKGRSVRTFRVGLLADYDEEEESPNPTIDFNAKCALHTGDLVRALKDAQVMGDYVRLTTSDEDLLIISAEGESGDVSSEIQEFLDPLTVTKGKQSSAYSLEYLLDIMKASRFATRVNLAFSTDNPVELVFPLEHDARLTFMLAPRVDEDDDDEDEDLVDDEVKGNDEEDEF